MADTPGWKFPNWERAHDAYSELGAEFAELDKQVDCSKAVGLELYSEAFLNATGNIEERKCKARIDPEYKQWAKVDHPQLVGKRGAVERRLRAAEIWFRMVQTTSANVRAERTYQ